MNTSPYITGLLLPCHSLCRQSSISYSTATQEKVILVLSLYNDNTSITMLQQLKTSPCVDIGAQIIHLLGQGKM